MKTLVYLYTPVYKVNKRRIRTIRENIGSMQVNDNFWLIGTDTSEDDAGIVFLNFCYPVRIPRIVCAFEQTRMIYL